MAEAKQSTQDRLQALAAELDSLERATTPAAAATPRVKPPRMELSPREKRGRRWLFWIIQGWGALVFLLMLLQDGGETPLWQWPLVAAFVCGVGWGIYGFHLFYWQLGKDTASWARRRFGSGSDEGER